MSLVRLLVLFGALLSLPACVPVVVVGAAGGGVMLDKEAKDGQQDNTSAEIVSAPKDEVQAQSIAVAPEVNELKISALKNNEPLIPAPIAQDTVVEVAPQAEKNEQNRPQPSSAESYAISELLNRGWKVALSDGILYFDANQNFYGFDGCRYFRGKYQAEANGTFMINSLMVSSKGSATCGNEITKNLFFVDSFKLNNGEASLNAKNALAMALTPQADFDAKAFLNKAKFKNRKRR